MRSHDRLRNSTLAVAVFSCTSVGIAKLASESRTALFWKAKSSSTVIGCWYVPNKKSWPPPPPGQFQVSLFPPLTLPVAVAVAPLYDALLLKFSHRPDRP